MKRRSAFCPTAGDALEDRLVLSHTPAQGLSVVVSGLYPRQQVLNTRQQPVIAEINQSFDSFESDYGQARAVYYSSIQSQPTGAAAAQQAFTSYTQQRVLLLAQQIISSFLQSPHGTARAPGNPELLKELVNRKITSVQGQAPAAGSLAATLTATIPAAGSSPATLSLFSLSQDNAIEAARVAVVNGFNIAKSGFFNNQSKNHH